VGTREMEGYEVDYTTADDGPAVNRDLILGTLAGLHALIKTFSISASSHTYSGVEQAQMTLEQKFEVALIPLFQFAIFYDSTMELHPGPDMTLAGRVHSNENMYLGSNSSLNIASFVSAAGDIIHGRHPNSGQAVGAGQVSVKNTAGVYQGMLQGGTWLDATQANWYDASTTRWGGRVQDAAHGQEELKLPLTVGGDEHNIIERANGGANPDSYENQAGLKIIDQKVFQLTAGLWVDKTAVAIAEGWFTTSLNAFKDYRENKDVDAVVLDVNGLKNSVLFPANGIIYASDQGAGRDYPALQLKNGSALTKAMTFVSEDPLYIQGDYNSVNKQPAAVIADAVTFLSGDWDLHKAQPNKVDRKAKATTVNVSYVTGNVPSQGGVYSGGAENLPRFLEDWGWGGGKKFIWRGSMVNLWKSEQAVAGWNGNYYTPPIRDWAFDTDLNDPNKIPPGTPRARSFMRLGWKQSNLGYHAGL